MVPAAPNAAFPTWPRDGRDGGVPDPSTKGPAWIQIGNEGGFLAKVAVIPPQPVDYDYNRQVIPLVGVTSNSLLLMPADRADVIVDFSSASSGDTLMLYNDAPAAMPNFWPLNDYYTDDPDQTSVGGAPTTAPGFGPNTRTVMQIRIAGSKTSSLDYSSPSGATLVALKAALPKAFAASQPPILVPQLAYNDAYPTGPHHYSGTVDSYVQGYQTTLNLTGTVHPRYPDLDGGARQQLSDASQRHHRRRRRYRRRGHGGTQSHRRHHAPDGRHRLHLAPTVTLGAPVPPAQA